ncbi:MAG: capsid protein [Ruminococcus sp.]|nr:capsid protein [Ruminococcus sp.]
MAARRGLLPSGPAQKYVDSEVLRYSDPYVPLLNSPLKRSGIKSTVIGSGRVHYDTPYARKNYYENRGLGKQGMAKGGKRGRLWWERMKADHKEHILKGVKRISGAK